MATIKKGAYRFNNPVSDYSSIYGTYLFNFVAGVTSYVGIKFEEGYGKFLVSYDSKDHYTYSNIIEGTNISNISCLNIFLPADAEVDDDFFNLWFNVTAEAIGAVRYGKAHLCNLPEDKITTLLCENSFMHSDLIISPRKYTIIEAPSEITENGTYKASDFGADGISEFTVNVESDNSGGGASFDNGYAVTFMSQGATWAVSGITPGQAVQRPTSPTKDGAYFNGWYTGEDGSGEKISFPYTPTADATLYAKFSQATVVGVTGVMNEEGSLTLTDDIAGMEGYEEAQNGDYVSVTSKLSEAFPFCEIEEFTDDEGNAFVKFPKLWMKWETDASDQITGYKFANYQADSDFFIPDAFLDPNYVTTDTYLDYFALGKYEMSGSTSKGYSKSGATCLVNVTRANARAAARAYGNSSNLYNGYQMLDFAQMTLYNLLCMMFFQTTNIQKVYGGRTGSGTVTSWSAASVTGTTDGVDGLNGWNVTTDCVKLLGVENPYGNVFKWVDGAYFSKGVIYAHRFPQQFNDGTTNGTALGFERPTSNGYITALKKGTADKTRSYVYAAAIGGDAGQYCGDYTYYSSTGTVLYAGGDWYIGRTAGLWCLYGDSGASASNSNRGARLSYRPL